MILETDRLIIRSFKEEDFNDYCDYAMDDEMSRMMGRSLLKTREDARLNFDWLKDREERAYVIVYREEDKVIGNLTIGNLPKELLDHEDLRGKVGRSMSFGIARDYRRMGLMTEALKSVIEELFSMEDMDYIVCGHFPFNEASKKLQESLGFKYLDRLKYMDGEKEIVSIESVLYRDNRE